MTRRPLITAAAATLVAALPIAVHTAAGGARAATTACSADMSGSGGSWPMYGQDLMGRQTQPSESNIGTANVADLTNGWSTPNTGYQSVPVVAGGCVFVVDATNGLEALDLHTGQQVWQATGLSTLGAFAPSVDTDLGRTLVHIGLQNGGNPVAAAFDASTGALVWKTAPITFGYPANQESSATVWTPPDFPDGVYLFTTTGPDFDPGAKPGYALIDATTGRILYQSTFIPSADIAGGYAGGGAWGTPSIDPISGVALIGTSNPDSQSKEHQHTNAVLKMDVDPGRPATFGHIVSYFKGNPDALVPQTYSTPACQATAGYFPNAGGYGGSPACTQTDVDFGVGPTLFRVPDGTLMAAIEQKSGTLWMINTDTMTSTWSVTIGPDGGPLTPYINRIATDGKTLYAVGDQTLFALDARTGSILWASPFAGQGGNCALANGVLYYVSSQGAEGFDAATGTRLWSVLLQHPTDTSDAVNSNSAASGVAIAGDQVVTNSSGVITDWHL